MKQNSKIEQRTDMLNINRSNNYVNDVKVVLSKTTDAKYLPKRAHPSDAGADLTAAESFELYPGDQKMIDTGVAVKIPEGYGGFVFNRSSQGKQGITIPHSVGVIDSDYRGNIKVILKNNGEDVYNIVAGETRVAQLVIMPVLLVDFIDSWNDTERGTGGFGSTGQ